MNNSALIIVGMDGTSDNEGQIVDAVIRAGNSVKNVVFASEPAWDDGELLFEFPSAPIFKFQKDKSSALHATRHDDTHGDEISLDTWLRDRYITDLFIAGIEPFSTALDAAQRKYRKVSVLIDAVRGKATFFMSAAEVVRLSQEGVDFLPVSAMESS